jgi:TatD DNase family protein
MTTLVDSHCHLDFLDLTPFGGSLERAIEAASLVDVKEILCISVSMENIPVVLKIAEQYPNVYASVGAHPSHNEGAEADFDTLVRYAAHPKVLAIGETGLDYHYDFTKESVQRERFVTHIKASQQTQKPLIIHTRKAEEDTLALLRAYQVSAGVFHCFTEGLSMAEAAIELGLYISFSGILTFKNAEPLREVARALPLERILVETDAPYLTPMPHRGKPNHPGYTRLVAECLAEIKGVSYETVAAATTANFHRLFNKKAEL